MTLTRVPPRFTPICTTSCHTRVIKSSILMGMEPCTGAWPTYQGLHSKENDSISLRRHQLSTAFQLNIRINDS